MFWNIFHQLLKILNTTIITPNRATLGDAIQSITLNSSSLSACIESFFNGKFKWTKKQIVPGFISVNSTQQ